MTVGRMLEETGLTETLRKTLLPLQYISIKSRISRQNVGKRLQTLRQSALYETFKQSALSLSFNLGGMVAGTLLALYSGVFALSPWTLAIYPGILSMRGIIGGLFCGRLSTGLHIGTVKANFTGNTQDFYLLWHAIITLALEGSMLLGVMASIFGIFFWGATVLDLMVILGTVTATMALSLVFISPITVAVSVLAYKRSLDPDIIVYPVISTVADIIVTACYVSVLTVVFSSGSSGYYLIGGVNLIFLCLVLYILSRNIQKKEFVKTIRESLLTMVSVALIVNVTGSFLTRITEVVGGRPEIYTVYPAVIDTIGDVGSIIGSTATTKLALGTLEPSFKSIRQHSTQIEGAWAASLVMFTFYSMISSLIQGSSPWKVLRFTTTLYVTNILSTSLMIIIAFAISILTYRRGLDPDNFVIPIESSLADTVTTLSLLTALNLIG